jgi:Uma2 family endonuclease
MSALSQPPRTIGELLHRLGDIPADRVRFEPPPGRATVADVVENQLCELVEGTLVEKAMGWPESLLAMALGDVLRQFLKTHPLGVVTGPDSTQQIRPDLVRMPDVSFFSWDRLPGRRIPRDPVPLLVPDLAVEILSRSNTPREMARKRSEYFQAGVRLVWLIDPKAQTVDVFTDPESSTRLHATDVLTGVDILPGFDLKLRDFFAELDARGETPNGDEP